MWSFTAVYCKHRPGWGMSGWLIWYIFRVICVIRLGRKSMFLFPSYYKGGSLSCIHIDVASKWSLTRASHGLTCDNTYKAAWPAKEPWKDFLFNLPFKETGWDTHLPPTHTHITIGQPYNMKIGAEWNSRGTVHPTRGPTGTPLISLKSTHDPTTYVFHNLEATRKILFKSPIIHLSGSVP